MNLEELMRLENAPIPLAQSNGCSVYQLRNSNGEGTMTIYDIFPGVTLMYNDFHMASYDSSFHTSDELFCIDHCREGRLEYEASDNAYSYVQAGDLKIDRRMNHVGHFSFPLSHYHGITIGFELPEAARALPEEVRDFPVDLFKLQKKFCNSHHPIIVRDAPSIDHVIGELYAVPEKIKIPYFKVKILELLLYLDALELPKETSQQPYFYKSQIEKIKAIHQLMTDNLETHYTLDELSKRFEISLTAMKNCFKTVYGQPVNTYMRSYRMNRAAVYLKQDKGASVTEIAGRVGYDSSSKFAAAFKAVIGKTPLDYRQGRIFIQDYEPRE